MSCTACGPDHHTNDNIHCEITPVKWLTIYDPVGMAIIVISGIGFLIAFIASCTLIQYRQLVFLGNTSPQIILLCSILLHITFAYGALHVLEPSQLLCQAVNSIFYLLLMLYTSIVMIQTKFFITFVMKHLRKWVCGRLIIGQILIVLILLLIEAVAVIIWFHIDKNQIKQLKGTTAGDIEIILRCEVDTTQLVVISHCSYQS